MPDSGRPAAIPEQPIGRRARHARLCPLSEGYTGVHAIQHRRHTEGPDNHTDRNGDGAVRVGCEGQRG